MSSSLAPLQKSHGPLSKRAVRAWGCGEGGNGAETLTLPLPSPAVPPAPRGLPSLSAPRVPLCRVLA